MKFPFEVFYDDECPLCKREIEMLRKRTDERVLYTPIMSTGAGQLPLTKTQLMKEIHGRTSDNEIITGVEVFRYLYTAAGFSWLVSITRWPLVRQVLDLGYRIFARYRLPITGRSCNLGEKESCQ